ncbi:MAG: TetR/AcrR family transcriptional regulator [Pseudomonadota bacterium]|jgi:AcrR family transcriptional regulator
MVAALNDTAQQASRQDKKTRETRRRLLNAARKLFAEKGIDLTTIDDITQRADLAKGTFYYHFSDKNDVIAELIRKIMGNLVQQMKERCKDVDTLDSLLESIIQVHIDFFSSRWEDFVLYYQGRADLKLKEGYSGLEMPFLEYLEAIETLVESVAHQDLEKPLLRRIGCAVAGFLSGYYSFTAIASEDEDIDANLQSLRGVLVSSMVRFINGALSQEKNNQVTSPNAS